MKALDTTLQAPDGQRSPMSFGSSMATRWLSGLRGAIKPKGNTSVVLVIDAAHCNQVPYMSLADDQAVLARGHGGKKSCLKPFEILHTKR